MGFSLGGNILAMALGKGGKELNDRVKAAACIEPPLVFSHAAKNIKTVWNGLLDKR